MSSNPFHGSSMIGFPVTGGPTWAEYLQKQIDEQTKTAKSNQVKDKAEPDQAEANEDGSTAKQASTSAPTKTEAKSEKREVAAEVQVDVETKTAATDETTQNVKTASTEGKTLDPSLDISEDTPPATKKAENKSNYVKVSSLEGKDKLRLFAALGADQKNVFVRNANTEPLSYIEAMTNVKFANLNPQTKKWLFDYWKNIHGEEYARLMVQDR